MNYLLSLIIGGVLLASFRETPEQTVPQLDLSSVDSFFTIVSVISESNSPTEKQWEELFASRGYSVYFTSDELRRALRETIITAFDPAGGAKRDSVLSLPPEKVYSSHAAYISRMCLENFLDMQTHWNELEDFRNGYDFTPVVGHGVEKLRTFLVDPVDSIFKVSTVSLLCYENDAHSRGENITMDYNKFFKQPEEENIGYIAHEMFHSYRYAAQGEEYRSRIFADPFLYSIDRISDEGIADLIDKPEDVPAQFRRLGVSPVLIERYEKAYTETPEILGRFDSITVALYRNEISNEEYAKAVDGFFAVGGHPNGLYMARVIRSAGLTGELLKLPNLLSPFSFIRIYDAAAEECGEYRFSAEFIQYLEAVKKTHPLPFVGRGNG